jgi:hypothetical protein
MLRLVRRPKSPNWIIRGTVRGIRIEESTGTSKRRIAEEIRAKRESELLAQSIYGRRGTCTFAEAALSYVENGGSQRFLKPVVEYFGTTPLTRIDQEAIERGGPEDLSRHVQCDAGSAVFHTNVGGTQTCCQTGLVCTAHLGTSGRDGTGNPLAHSPGSQPANRCLRRPSAAPSHLLDLHWGSHWRSAVVGLAKRRFDSSPCYVLQNEKQRGSRCPLARAGRSSAGEFAEPCRGSIPPP